MFSTSMTMFIRGEGGWGGDRGPSGNRNPPPERAPDHVVSYQTRPDQALIYRLSGDRNPLHSDPKFAELAGFGPGAAPHPSSDEWAHLLVEAARLAGHDRSAVLHDGADGHALLADDRLGPRADALDPHRAAHPTEQAGLIAHWLRVQLDAAAVERGAHDDRIAAWLAGWEPETVQVIAGWVRRAATGNRP